MFGYIHVGLFKLVTSERPGEPGIFAFPSPRAMMALSKGIMMLLLMYGGAAGSGAHFNPNTTFATVVLGHTTVTRGLMYMGMQMLGAITGFSIARASWGWDAQNLASLGGCSKPYPTGPYAQPGIDGKISDGAALAGTYLTFMIVLFMVGGTALDENQGKLYGPILIAASLMLAIFVGIPLVSPVECWG